MAHLEVAAALPRPESSSHPPQHPEATPPAVETISGPTSEGSGTLHDLTRHNSISSLVNHSTLSRTSHSPRSESSSPANITSPSLSAQESRIASGVVVPFDDAHRSSSTELVAIPPSIGTPPPMSSANASSGNPSTTTTSLIDGISNSSIHHSSAAPKRFIAVNVNRQFLEKSSTASSVPTAPVTTGAKLGNQTHSSQPPAPHSRLVTTKLTSLAQTTHPSMVWRSAGSSAPSSSGSTPAAQATGSSPSLAQPATAHHSKAASQPSTSASAKQTGSASKASSSQPGKAWGARRNSNNNLVVSNGGTVEFPTAAEAASNMKAKMESAAASASQGLIEAAALKLQQAAAADAFRGVHLDPKAHHWDDDGDDDDFLNEPIEFGDGRQYTIKHSEPETKDSMLSHEGEEQHPPPISKEDRFGADISRHWPPEQPAAGLGLALTAPDARVPDASGGRALFNERSNRFEYAGSYRAHGGEPSSGGGRQAGSATSPSWGRRDSHSESQGRWPHERTGAPSSSTSVQTARRTSVSIQDGEPSRSPTKRTNSFTSNRGAGHLPRSDSPGPNGLGLHSRSRGPSFTEHQRDGGFSREPRTDTAPPTRDRSRESVRDKIPHLNRGMPPPPTISHSQRRPSHGARDMPPPPVFAQKTGSPSVSSATTSPLNGPHRTPFPLTSPRIPHPPLAPPPPHDSLTLKSPTIADIQVFSKESMQTAAERARQRKKLEEEEREKEKERARQKAAELAAAAEAKDAARRAEAARLASAEAAADALIKEEAERLAKAGAENEVREGARPAESSHEPDQASGPPMWRIRSSRGSKRGGEPKAAQSPASRDSSSHPTKDSAPSPVTSPASARPLNHPRPSSSWANVVKDDKAGETSKDRPASSVGGSSWRTRAPSLHAQQPLLGVSVLPTLHDVNLEEQDTLETIDFSDMGKLVGEDVADTGSQSSKTQTSTEGRARPSEPTHDLKRSDVPRSARIDEKAKDSSSTEPSPVKERIPSPLPSASSRGIGMSSPASSMTGLMSPQALANLPLPPSKQHFRESSMSALEDVMSRIKGALSDMRPGESAKELEEALAAASASRKAASDDSFATTRPGRPVSPSPLHRRTHVRLRKSWSPKNREPVDSRRLYFWKLPPRPVRLDILSWEPPVEGMSRRTLSRDELLFPPSGNAVVSLPKPPNHSETLEVPVPRVKLPGNSGKGRQSRKYQRNEVLRPLIEELSTTSRSPPPASPARQASTSLPSLSSSQSLKISATEAPSTSTPSTTAAGGRPRTSSRPVIGADGVAFSPRLTASNDSSSSLVSFTVTSELEAEENTPVPNEDKQSTPQSTVITGLTVTTGESTPPEDSRRAPTSRTITPPPKVTPWAKSPLVYHAIDSPSSRNVAADPENIKSLWEKNENEVVTTENSLKDITDEPPSFSLQDMKSDDGDEPKALKVPSPPPTTTSTTRRPTIRMSVHDAHRAFQQVPTAPSGVPEPSSASSYGFPPQEDSRALPTATAQQPQPPTRALGPQYPSLPSSSPVVYPQNPPYVLSPIGQPQQRPVLANGHHTVPNGQAPSHVWMQVNPPPGGPLSSYYRPHPYGQAVIYPPSTSYSPGLTSMTPLPMQLPKPMNGIGASPGRAASHQGSTVTPQVLSPVTAPSPMPTYLSGRGTPSYYTPGPQSSQLPMVYPSSPAPMYSAAVSTTPSGSPGPALYTTTPHTTYRPPPTR